MRLSVVLVNFNGRDCIHACIGALESQTATREFEIIVVDSGSTDGSWNGLASQFEHVRVIRFDDNIGFCAGCNRGAEAAIGEHVAFVNFDGVVEANWDLPLLEALATPGITIAGGMLIDPDGQTVEAVGLGVAANMATYGLNEGLPRTVIPAGHQFVPAVSGALMMVVRNTFLANGGFNEDLWMYGDEIDLCLRIGGHVVVDPRSVIRHEMGHAAGPNLSPLRTYWSSRNRLINASRHLPAVSCAKAILASAAFDLAIIASSRQRHTLAAILRGWKAGAPYIPRERGSRSSDQRESAAQVVDTFRMSVRQFLAVRDNRKRR